MWLAAALGVAAILYSSVGHGGASAYLGLMALFSVAPDTMRSTALTLNLLVSGLALVRFGFARQINARLVAMLAVTAAPAAFVGGMIVLPGHYYKPLVGLVLLFAAARLIWQPVAASASSITPPPASRVLPTGLVIGLLAGLTGTGGGIFLSPLLILCRWEEPRRASGVAAGFVFINSLAGLAGNYAALRSLPAELPWLLASVGLGALVGTWLGVEKLPRRRILQSLGCVLIIAGLKLIFT